MPFQEASTRPVKLADVTADAPSILSNVPADTTVSFALAKVEPVEGLWKGELGLSLLGRYPAAPQTKEVSAAPPLEATHR